MEKERLMKKIRFAVLLAMAWFALSTAAPEVHAQTGTTGINASITIAPRAKRVWTNDDFAPASPKPVNATEVKKPAAPAATAPPPSPEAEQARKEVVSEMLSSAQLRQRAYESNLAEIRNKLQEESNAFRRQVYEKFIRDVEALSANNRTLINQLSSSDKPVTTPAGGK